jgi:hypothetical protein
MFDHKLLEFLNIIIRLLCLSLVELELVMNCILELLFMFNKKLP